MAVTEEAGLRRTNARGLRALGAGDAHFVAVDELAPTAEFDLAVDTDLALGDQVAGVGTGLGEVGQLEELA